LPWVEAGAGEPAVVLETGMNCGAASWQRVMPLLAPHVRVAAYDRAGIGGSAPGPLRASRAQLGRHAGPAARLPAAGPGRGPGPGGSGARGHGTRTAPARPVGWRVINAVVPDELHDDAPVTLAAIRELRAAARPFPDVPVVVLSAVRGFPRRFRAHWTRLQAALAAAAPRGRHVVVDGSGHNIPRDRPDAVADTILAVAAQAQPLA